ncbi:MAG: MFS transporter [Alicyclobacillaceae bacterium]|nr:MFS transporter [Alicyclobacillaceae bacterium]
MNRSRLLSYENGLLLLLFCLWGIVFSDRLAVSYLMPFISKDLHLDNTQIGMISSALSLTFAFFNFFGGWFSDAIGKKKPILLVAILAFSLCSVFTGVVGGVAAMIAVRMIMGAAEGPILPIAQSIMAIESSDNRRGFNMAFLQSGAGTVWSVIIAPVVLVALANAYGWRHAFYLTIIPGIILVILAALFVREPKIENFKAPLTDAAEAAGQVRYRDVFRHRNVWLCLIIGIFFNIWFGASFTFGPVFYTEVKHFSASTASYVMSITGIGGLFWTIVGPILSDRFGRKPIMVIFSFVCALTPIVNLVVNSVSWLVILGVVFAVAGGPMALYMATIPAESIPARFHAATIGLMVGTGELLGSAVGNTLVGMAADKFGLSAVQYIAIGCAILVGILSMFLIETLPSKVKVKASARQMATAS